MAHPPLMRFLLAVWQVAAVRPSYSLLFQAERPTQKHRHPPDLERRWGPTVQPQPVQALHYQAEAAEVPSRRVVP